MSVYFIQAGDGGPVKIGFATDAQERLTQLQIGNHEPLSLIRVIRDGTRQDEQWFLRRSKASRLRGEWFRFCPEMLREKPPTWDLFTLRRQGARTSETVKDAAHDLEARRLRIGLKRPDLCKTANVHRTTMTRWLQGNFVPKLSTYQRLLEVIVEAEKAQAAAE